MAATWLAYHDCLASRRGDGHLAYLEENVRAMELALLSADCYSARRFFFSYAFWCDRYWKYRFGGRCVGASRAEFDACVQRARARPAVGVDGQELVELGQKVSGAHCPKAIWAAAEKLAAARQGGARV